MHIRSRGHGCRLLADAELLPRHIRGLIHDDTDLVDAGFVHESQRVFEFAGTGTARREQTK